MLCQGRQFNSTCDQVSGPKPASLDLQDEFISMDVASVFSMGKERKQEKLLTYLHKLLCRLPKMLPTNTLIWLESV